MAFTKKAAPVAPIAAPQAKPTKPNDSVYNTDESLGYVGIKVDPRPNSDYTTPRK